MQKLFGLKRGKARNAWNVRRTLNQIPGNGTTEEKHNLRNIAMSGMNLEIEDDERNRKWFSSSSKQEILSGTDFVFQSEFQFLRYIELPLTTKERFFTFVKTPSTWMTWVTNWKVSINQITLLFNFFLLKKITPPLSILSAFSSIFYKFYNISSFRSAMPQNWMAHKSRSGTNTSFSFSVKFRTIKGTFFHFFAGPSLCVEDRACPVISSKYLCSPSTPQRRLFSRTHKTLRQCVDDQSIFSGNFLPLGVLILLFLFVKKWKSYSGWLWWKQLTCSRLCLRQWLLFTRNEHTNGNTLRQKIHAAEKEQEIYV